MRFAILYLFFTLGLCLSAVRAQHRLAPADRFYLTQLNDSLAQYGAKILDEILPLDRVIADSMFTRLWVRALRTPYSFYYPFDAVETASIQYPPDSSFRIITWHYTLNESDFRQKGVLQMNTPDGSPKFFPLFDVSEFTDEPQEHIRDAQNWIGALYYKIIQNEWQGKKYYTLLGYDENNALTTRKWMDILTFDDRGEPRWGADIFVVNNDSIFPPGAKRFLLEYKTEGRARLNYDDEEGMIIMDYLVSESNEPEKRYTLVPGGDYAAFVWDKGVWRYIPRLDNEVLGDGNEPRPALILADDGSANEIDLERFSERNMRRIQPAEKTSKKEGKKKPSKTTLR